MLLTSRTLLQRKLLDLGSDLRSDGNLRDVADRQPGIAGGEDAGVSPEAAG
jgi:hypothetical protein